MSDGDANNGKQTDHAFFDALLKGSRNAVCHLNLNSHVLAHTPN